MGKITWGFILIVVACFIGLVGCSEKTAKEKQLEEKIAELEEQLEQQQKEKKDSTKDIGNPEKEEEQIKEEEQPIVVTVLDPNTKQVLRTFHPDEMGYETESEKYKEEIESWVKELARGTDTTEGYDKRLIPDKIGPDGQIIKGSPRVILEESELVDKLMMASENGGTVELPLYVTESGYQPQDAPFLSEVVVASYTTHFNSGVAGRSKNIELSAQAINNVIVGKGDIFSFNTTVGPSDAAHGYQPAPEIVNGKLVDGIGGGICQTSSTLFNAVDKLLGVSYVEKHHHSLSVGYVPEGRDATVSYGGLDFRFQNKTNVPFLIKAIVNKGTLTVEVRTSKANQSLLKKNNG